MNDRELEVEALLAGDLVHDVDHPGEARIRSRGTGRADDQRDAGLDRTRHHDLGVALDRCRGEHAGAGGKRTGTGVGATGQPIIRAPSEIALSSESGRNPEPSIPVAETSGNDAIATLPDRCSGGGYRLSRGRETSCHRRPPLGRALIRSQLGTVPASSKTAISLVTRRPESPAHTGDR